MKLLFVVFLWATLFAAIFITAPGRVVYSPKSVTVTNYVTMPKEFGPDGYGFRHLRREDSEFVLDCLMKMDNPFKHSTWFEDLRVTKTVTHDPMTSSEIMEILHRHPNVASVSLSLGGKRSFFSIGTLAFPQYEREYTLSKEQWQSLKDYCRIQLISPTATDEVVEHWKSVTNGIVPFGLRVK